ncbi:MAG: hypothetical protein OXG44_10730 [Gammaproteobacteria bacterium]|nr:hypothetical protein [Gammaproteobacteria bacterium]
MKTDLTDPSGDIWSILWSDRTITMNDLRAVERAQATRQFSDLFDFFEKSILKVSVNGVTSSFGEMPVSLIEEVVAAHPQFQAAPRPA